MKQAPQGMSLIARFMRRTKIINSCWIWRGYINPTGYGCFQEAGERSAHRVSWILFYGAIPKGLCVLHKCDIKACVNPKHLYLGSRKDNMRDALERNRLNPRRGDRHPDAKLSSKDVLKIRKLYSSGKFLQKELAEKFNVHRATISDINVKKSWGHL